MIHKLLALSAIWMLCISAIACGQSIDVPIRTLTEPEDTATDRLRSEVPIEMRAFVDARIVPGLTCVVASRDETLLLTTVGWKAPGQSDALDGDEIYWLASITKPMAATAFMMLVDEGKVELDDPVSKYLPEFANTTLKDGSRAVVTVRHALTHTSGLRFEKNKPVTSLREAVGQMVSNPLDFQPGSSWKYSRSLDVTARIAEEVSGLEFSEYMSRRLFDPLGMTDTTFNLTPEQTARAVPPSELNDSTGGLTQVETDLISFDQSKRNWPSASYAAFSTAADLTKFAQFLLNHGKVGEKTLLSERAVDAMTSLQTGELKTGWTPGNGWGLGWCHVRFPQHVTRTLSPGSFGHGGVYGPQLWIDPNLGVAYILLYERKDIGNADGSDLREVFQVSAARALRSPRTSERPRD